MRTAGDLDLAQKGVPSLVQRPLRSIKVKTELASLDREICTCSGDPGVRQADFDHNRGVILGCVEADPAPVEPSAGIGRITRSGSQFRPIPGAIPGERAAKLRHEEDLLMGVLSPTFNGPVIENFDLGTGRPCANVEQHVRLPRPRKGVSLPAGARGGG